MREATETEMLIKNTAKKVFFAKGHINASTKEIATEAGVNRALIHYYFRSRDSLFNMVLEEAMRDLTGKMSAILGSALAFRPKIRAFLDAFIEEKAEYPYLGTFIVTELAKNPEKVREFHAGNEALRTLIHAQISQEIQAGRLQPIEPEHFVVNLMSLCNYPLIAKPMLQSVFGYDEDQYRTFLLDRKRVVYRTIFNEPYPEN